MGDSAEEELTEDPQSHVVGRHSFGTDLQMVTQQLPQPPSPES